MGGGSGVGEGVNGGKGSEWGEMGALKKNSQKLDTRTERKKLIILFLVFCQQFQHDSSS